MVQFPTIKKISQPRLTMLEQEQARVQVLTAYLDKTDPDWRDKINDLIEG